MTWQIWLLPALVVGSAILLSFPLGRYLAWVLDGKFQPPGWLAWFERRLDTGPQTWQRYALALVTFNLIGFAVGFALLALQPLLPLNPPDPTGATRGMLSPTTIFHTICSFLSNTNQQHYSGEVHLSYCSQIWCIGWNMFVTPAIGLAALLAIIRGLRGDPHLGNFFLDVWRGLVYVLLPLSVILALLLLLNGVPMTWEGSAGVQTVEPGAMGIGPDGNELPQIIARGPVAAIVAIKQLGTNGGGFFAANSAHPFENPNALTNLASCVAIILLPFACVVMFGRMLNNRRHALVIYGVMLALYLGTLTWGIYWDTLHPNPALTDHPPRTARVAVRGPEGTMTSRALDIPAVAGLPVDQALGNLEGKELRFGTSAGATWAATTTVTSNGSVNAMHDSLNPLAGLTPLTGMWLNCAFGGVGVGLINLLVYLITGVFLAGLMVGRTPEYLGKKVEAREMKLAMLALLAHPILILLPTGLFAALSWNAGSANPTGPHAFYEMLYEFTSASANNGSGAEGLGDTYGFNDNRLYPDSPQWDIACGLVLLLARYIPIIAPLALAGSLAAKRPTPFTVGTLRTDTLTFGVVLLGTIILVGALLFLPAAVLGPVAEHLGPLPFGQ
jgi:K+-transporting ATPase ATPase A chain